MLTRKGLTALADGVAEGARNLGLAEEAALELGRGLSRTLRAEGQITPNFDAGRFDARIVETYNA